MSRVLFLTQVWPEPRSSAAGSRTMQLMSWLAGQGASVDIASAAAETPYGEDLSTHGYRTTPIELNSDSFDAWVGGLNPEVVFFDRFMTEEQFGWRVERTCPDALRIVDTIDLHCLRRGREAALKKGRAFVPRDLFNDVAVREIASLHRADLALMISPAEADLLQDVFQFRAEQVHVTPFLLNPVEDATPAFPARSHFVTIGNFRHPPNADSVSHLCRSIWPSIREALPDTELHVYGAYAPKHAHEIEKEGAGIRLRGRAEDAIETLRGYRVLLAPLRYGAGLKGKLADAMCSGTPSVTTAIGAEGMQGGRPWCGAVEDDPARFAEAAVELYRDEAAWGSAQRAGFALVKHRFNRDREGHALSVRLRDLRYHLVARREANWTGVMMRHHRLKSAEYMSRWIEAKSH